LRSAACPARPAEPTGHGARDRATAAGSRRAPVPAIPAPPPALPDIPDEAHAACANKANGSSVTLKLGPRETMRGLCERVGGKMVFQLRSYRLDD
jgi:hypothetical protein